MKRMKLAAVLLVISVGVVWVSAAAAQRARLGQPVTAVPRAEKAPAQYQPDRREGSDASVSGLDTKRPDSGAQQEQGPSKAYLEEQEAGRHRD